MTGRDVAAYSGTDNLEIMAEAVRYNRHLSGLLERHAPADDRPAMDFGAGAGTFARSLAAKGRRIVCVEPDDGLRSRLESLGFEAVAALDELAGRKFDLIYSLNVLEHIEDDRSALLRLRAYLSDDGVLLLYVPAFQLLFSSMDRKVGHFRRYRKAGLVSLLQETGYAVDQARYVDSLGFLASLVYRVLGRDDGTLNRRALVAYDRWAFPISLVLDRILGCCLGKNLLVTARTVQRD